MIGEYRDLILNEYEKRKSKNPAYSLRAYSRDLGVKQSTLSRMLNRQIGLSVSSAKKIVERLQVSEIEQELFITLVESKHARSLLQRQRAEKKVKQILLSPKIKKIDEKTFQIIREWYHLAIYSLVALENFQPTVDWISKRLGLPILETKKAIQNLFDTKMIFEEGGKWYQSKGFPICYSRIPSKSIRTYHRQMLKIAESTLESVPIHQRDFNNYIIPISESQYEEIAQAVRKSVHRVVSMY